MKKNLIIKSALIIMIATFASKITGLIREQYVFYLFGATDIADAFRAAYRIPNTLRDLLAEGAFSAAFIMIFSKMLTEKNKAKAFNFANKIVNLSFLLTITVSVILLIFSKPIMSLIFKRPDTLPLAVTLFNIMLPFIVFISLSAVMMGILNSQKKFTIPAISPLVSNVVYIATLYLASTFFFTHQDTKIYSVVLAVIMGGFAQFLIQFIFASKTGFKFNISLDFKDNDVKRFFSFFLPIALTMGIPKINNFISQAYASTGVGWIVALFNSFLLIQLPLSVFVQGISTISLPTMSAYYKQNDLANFKRMFAVGMRFVAFFTIPVMIGFLVLSDEITNFVLRDLILIVSGGERGSITAQGLFQIREMLFNFAPAVVAMGTSIIVLRSLQSMEKMLAPFIVSVIYVASHATLTAILTEYVGYSGIAMSFTISSFINVIILIVYFNIKMKELPWAFIMKSVAKIVFASSFMGVMIMFLRDMVFVSVKISASEYVNNFFFTLIYIGVGGLIYASVLLLLKEEAFIGLIDKLKEKFFSKSKK